MDIQIFCFIVLWLLMFISSCYSLYNYKHFPLVLKGVVWFLAFTFVEQTAIFLILFWYEKLNRYFLFHIGNVGEAITLLWMYREIFKRYIEEKEKYRYRKIFIALMALFVVFATANIIWCQPLTVYPSYTRIVLSMIVIILNVLYIYKYTIAEPIPRTGLELVNYQMSKISIFWITIGLLLFHSFSIMRYGFLNILREEFSKESYRNISIVQTSLIIVLYIFIIIGILKAKRIIVVDEEDHVDDKKI